VGLEIPPAENIGGLYISPEKGSSQVAIAHVLIHTDVKLIEEVANLDRAPGKAIIVDEFLLPEKSIGRHWSFLVKLTVRLIHALIGIYHRIRVETCDIIQRLTYSTIRFCSKILLECDNDAYYGCNRGQNIQRAFSPCRPIAPELPESPDSLRPSHGPTAGTFVFGGFVFPALGFEGGLCGDSVLIRAQSGGSGKSLNNLSHGVGISTISIPNGTGNNFGSVVGTFQP
jgi:hypothetical protein